ncbi:MAG: sigma-54-dependent transcriptional regulator [Nitrospiria bacterium]
MKGKILVIDDEKLKRVTLKTQLEDEGYSVEIGENAFVGLDYLRKSSFDVVVTDLRMPSMDGLTFLREIKRLSPEIEVIMMTAYGTIENAVEAMKEGAYDYITKPFPYDALSIKLNRLMEYRKGKVQIATLQKKIQSQYCYQNLIGHSRAMRTIYEKADAVADSDTSILIQGETGTGKELLANALHYNSHRKYGPFITLSCAILNREILESELFGHEKGAFTGALRRKRGRFELADKGTIFLDDVDDIPVELQVKLLRVIEERAFERVGGEQPLKVNVRVICATKKDLQQMVSEGKFREDLYYRLNVVKIELPPLRARREDISLLARHFLKKLCKERNKSLHYFTHEVQKVLLRHDWPGNVRELENIVEHAVTLSKSDRITVDDLPDYIRDVHAQDGMVSLDPGGNKQINLSEAVSEVEAKLILWALKEAEGNQVKAAKLLNIPRTTLRDKLARLRSLDNPSTNDDSTSPYDHPLNV